MSGFQNKVVFSEGSKITPTSSGSRADLQQAATDVARINYTGNPEGVISANPASLCHDPVSGLVYKKDSGVGNTGWSQLGGAGTITGSTGGALSQTSGNWNIVAGANAGGSVKFDGASSTLSLNVSDANDNIFFGRVSGTGSPGPANVGIGTGTFQNINTGQWNCAVGFVGLNSLTSGERNNCLGFQSLALLTTGTRNVAIGYTSGIAYTSSESNNVLIQNDGVTGESGKTRIGNANTNSCFIAGITGVTVANSEMVTCDSNGQLGTAPQGFKLIQTQTVSNVATVDFTTGFGSYTKLFISYKLGPETNGNSLGMQQSVDGGATWAGNFTWGLNYFPINSATFTNVWNNSSTPMQLTDVAFDYANYQANGYINIRNFQENFSLSVTFDGNFVYQPTTTWSRVLGLGQGLPNVNALRFLASAGNITGSISVYGLAS